MPEVPFTIDNKGLMKVRDEVLRFVSSRYSSLSHDDCEDLSQEAMLVMYKNVRDGRLTRLTSNLTTYVIGIVKNLARAKSRQLSRDAEGAGQQEPDDEDSGPAPVDLGIAEEALRRWQDAEMGDDSQAELERAVQELVEHMPEPCRTILWAYYWEGKSMREIAAENNYTGKDVAKSTKSRCMTKVKKAMTEIRNRLRS